MPRCDARLHPHRLLSCVRPRSATYVCFLRRYTWRTTEWSDCRIDLLLSQQERRRGNLTSLCGGGLQTREVFCVQANAELLKYLNDLREKDKGKNAIESCSASFRRSKAGSDVLPATDTQMMKNSCVMMHHGTQVWLLSQMF